MQKIAVTIISLVDAETKYGVSSWEPYNTQGPALEKWKLDPPDLRQEAVYILKGAATVKAMGCEFHLEPGHLITLDTGVEFYWMVEAFVESVYKHDQEI